METRKANEGCVIGVDFGTDSARSLIVDAATGEEIAGAVHHYARWREGRYCDPARNQFRQHPLDYLEGLTHSVRAALAEAPARTAEKIRGISVDTTGSTPVAVDREGAPLALHDDLAENPNAMFVLWKDHTAVAEAEEINHHARSWGGEDYTQYSGGVYSSEWFWAKILHILRADAAVRESACSWVEHCDWIPAALTGRTDVRALKRSRCAAGHKAMWREQWGGLPAEEFLARIDPLLGAWREKLYTRTYTSDVSAGTLSREWTENFESGAARNWEPVNPEDWRVLREGANRVYALTRPFTVGVPRRPIQISLLKDESFADFTMTCRVRRPDPKMRSLILVFGYQDETHFYYAHLSSDSSAKAWAHNGLFIVDGAPRRRLKTGNCAWPINSVIWSD